MHSHKLKQQLLINHLIHFIYPISPGDTYVHHAIALGLHVTVLILLKGGLEARGSKLMPDKMEQGDTYVHHAIALGLHVTVLILLKGGLEARGSKLMPDKMEQAFGFSCDGPGRGGTCDLSAWDSFYLAVFWMLNCNTWISFYFHYKLLAPNEFDKSSTYLESWFRDYLWFNSTPLIHGYSPVGTNDLSVQSWSFLLTHLVWATGFMFLISWRGYWQELIDIILYSHFKTPILINLWAGEIYTPAALSIVQASLLVQYFNWFLQY